ERAALRPRPTCERLRDHAREETEPEQEHGDHDEERDVLEPRVVECEVEQDKRQNGCGQDPERAPFGLRPTEDGADNDRNSEESRVVDGATIEDRASHRCTNRTENEKAVSVAKQARQWTRRREGQL